VTRIERPRWAIRPLDGVLYGYAFVLFTLLLIHLTFTHRSTHGDEDGLYNAIYMYQQTARVTYPMQHQFEWMTVHPPMHYFIVGVVANTGLHIFHAAAVPHVLIALVAIVATVTSGFRYAAKYAVLTGFTLATLVYTPLYTIRPDGHLTLAWFCGLVLLESARAHLWDGKRLFFGSFFVAYASGVHYWGGVAGLMLPVYVLAIVIRPRGASPLRAAGWMVAGSLLFYVPYAVFFVIPEFTHIVDMLRSANFGRGSGGGIRESLRMHWAQLDLYVNPQWPAWAPRIGALAIAPFKALRLPPLVLAVPVLLLSRSLRGMAIAGAIVPLYVMTMVARKGGLFYIAPELILYTIAWCLVLFSVVDFGCRFLGARSRIVVHAAAALLAALILVGAAPATRDYGLTAKLIDWDVSRAANQLVIGRNARIAINNVWTWYTSGAARIYWIVTQVSADDLRRIDGKWKLDSIALINDWYANRVIPFPDFYLGGALELQGFYFPAKWYTDHDQVLPMLHLTLRRDGARRGYGYDRATGVVNEYIEDPTGNWMFVTMAIANRRENWPEDPIYFVPYLMREGADAQALYAFVTTRERWQRDRSRLAASGTIRDEVPMTMRELTDDELLAAASQSDQRIEFKSSRTDPP
jgi:hypothetical protein